LCSHCSFPKTHSLFRCLNYPFLSPALLHSRIHRRVRNQNISALLSTGLVVLLIALSAVILGQALATGLSDVYHSLSNSGEGSERLSLYLLHLCERAVGVLSCYLPVSSSDMQTATVNQAQKGVVALLGMSARALGNVTALLVNAFIAFFILFFFLRGGKAILRRAAVLSHSGRSRVSVRENAWLTG
jgi:predicted PurR-regulated permease PerM